MNTNHPQGRIKKIYQLVIKEYLKLMTNLKTISFIYGDIYILEIQEYVWKKTHKNENLKPDDGIKINFT